MKKKKTEELRPQIESQVRGKLLENSVGLELHPRRIHTAFAELLDQGKLEDQLTQWRSQ